MFVRSSKKESKPPTRRMDRNDKVLISTAEWNGNSDLQLEDKVSLADKNAAFLQGLVVYVGTVHFAQGTYVGIQLTGPSIGRGNCNGVFQGKKYFADVGKNNGILAPVNKVNKRVPKVTGEPQLDQAQEQRTSEQARMVDLEFIDTLTQTRALALLKLSEEKANKRFGFHKEETHINRLKQMRMVEQMRSRGADPMKDVSDKSLKVNEPKLKYAPRDSKLCAPDLELAEGLEMTQQNFCLSDPTLPDNPITFASQSFLNMTGYNLNEILGRNCRFLQGEGTDEYAVNRLRLAIKEGADCHVCLLNYRKDGTPFYNRLFMTALRDTKGRVKNYLGVQCEVSAEVAQKINTDEKVKLECHAQEAKLESTQDMSGHDTSDSSSTAQSSPTLTVDSRKANRRKANRDAVKKPVTAGTSSSSKVSLPRPNSAPSLSPSIEVTTADLPKLCRWSSDGTTGTLGSEWATDIEEELANYVTEQDVYEMYNS